MYIFIFNNSNSSDCTDSCCLNNCIVCKKDMEDKSGILSTSVTKNQYKLGGRELNCNDGGFMLHLLLVLPNTVVKLSIWGNV